MSVSKEQEEWAEKWLKTVVSGENTMSQRKLTSIEKYAGSLAAIKKAAKSMGLHLLLVENDEGNQVVAASTKPFKVIC